MKRPEGSNADEWALFIEEYKDAPEYLAVQIAEALDILREETHQLRELIYIYIDPFVIRSEHEERVKRAAHTYVETQLKKEKNS